MEDIKKCPKCSGEMEEGVVADRGHYDSVQYPVWGTRLDINFFKPFSKVIDQKNVKTNRCKNCGYLESYAK
jgi:predicted nucleic-acid-binding Zn-ribbon protein